MKDYSKLTLNHPQNKLWDKMINEVKDYAFILLDKNGIILNWNTGAMTIKGYSPEDVIGKHFRIFYEPEEQEKGTPESLIEKASREGRALNEGWRVRKDGTLFWGSVVITALHDDEGEIIGFAKVTRDLTENRRAEEMLRQKNKDLERMNQELTSFAYVASHDLQEPLRKIQTFSSRILELEKDKFSERTVDYFARMQNAAERMEKLIQDLLMYSRTNTVEKKLELIDLNDIIGSVRNDLEELIHEKQAVIELGKLPQIEGIKFQLHQVFLNLIGNSLKFSKADTPPVISISHKLVSGAEVPASVIDKKAKYHHVKVKDNGIGFEPEYKEKIFEIFQRLHGRAEYSGSGIGLSICKKIMENHHGYINAESAPNQGATFHLFIPEKVVS